MIKINYLNGLYSKANKVMSKEIGYVGNTIIWVQNEGFPFRGTPDELERDAVCHINEQLDDRIGIFPVELYVSTIANEGTGCKQFTNEVIFQANIISL